MITQINRQLVLENNQAPGDSLMFTCAVRDLHKQFPNEFQTSIRTLCRDIWRDNPYAVNVDRNKKRDHLRIGYSSSINVSNQRAGHFSSGFVQDLSEKLGIRVRLTDIRPDVYLTDEEKDPARYARLGPFWVVVAGGKKDFTAKIWDPAYYQSVVNALPDTKFVQVGNPSHIHKPLTKVVNMLGKTTLRDLLTLIYHSEGVVCPVTCTMHMAAAFNKPCVVIAGGREAWWWEAYTHKTWEVNIPGVKCPVDFVDHAFLHTIGDMDCCSKGGCWRNGVGEHKNRAKDCKHILQGPTWTQPKCMKAIKPEMVVEAIRTYQRGEQLTLTDIPVYLKPPLFKEPLPEPKKAHLLTQPMPQVKIRRVKRNPRRGRGYVNRKRFLRQVSRQKPKMPEVKPTISPSPVQRKVNVRKPKPTAKSAPRANKPLPALETPVTVGVLLYGDYTDIARRCLTSLYKTTSPKLFELRIGLNAVSKNTLNMIDRDIMPHGNVRLYREDKNIFKYPIMRKMLWDDPQVSTKWFVWMDDDTHITQIDWLPRLDRFLQAAPSTEMIGKKYFAYVKQPQINWMKQAKWWRGRALPTRKGMPKVDFVTGGYWAIRTHVAKKLDLPDPRLSHQGDIEIGAAVYQNKVTVKQFYYGVRISDHQRRGASQKRPSLDS